ncbi:MAG: penicillin-binding transpeptidase domain-containing protein [Gaiellaceae bacterium]
MAISRPDPRRRPKLPRNVGGRRRVQPYSHVDAPYFRSPGFYVRIGGLAVVVAVGLSLLLLRAWSIQVLHGKQYSREAHQQAYRTVDLVGARGAIVDDRDRLLAGTTGHVVVDADAASLGSRDAHGVWSPSADGMREISRLAHFAGLRKLSLVRQIAHDVLQSPFAPAIVIPHPRAALANYLQERANSFPGFKVEVEDSRSYPLGAFGASFLGLLGQVSRHELKSGAYRAAQPGELVGQTGVEAMYDSVLNAGFVKAKIPVDSLGRIAGLLVVPQEKRPPTLQLSIDERLQKATEKAILDGMADARTAGYSPTGGSAVAIDPYTGAIKAIASYPTFNQRLAAGNSKYLAQLYRNTVAAPTLNRAIAGVYPTGSTFKPIIAEAALSAGIITPYTQQECTGSFTLGNHTFFNVERGIFESMDLPTALAQSCDTWFYRLGDRIWQHEPRAEGTLIQHWASLLGLGHEPKVDLTGASAGYLPTPGPDWDKLEGYPWTEGQTINLSIGQGALQVSPLQLAVAYSALVNGGTVLRPHVAEAVIRNGVKHVLRFKPVRKLKLTDAWAIKQGLYQAANTAQGTSFQVFGGFHPAIAGKTGTAEAPPRGDHSWYASWAPYNHPKLLVVVQIEHGGFGADAAAPGAKEIYQAYFHSHG